MPKQVDHVNQMDRQAAPPAGEAADDDVLDAVHAVMHRTRAQLQLAMRDGGQDLTPMEARVLGFFARHPGATAVELARHSGRDKGQLARLITGLKDRGLLQPSPDETDRRATRLHLSASAQQQHQAVQQLRRQLAERAVAGLGPSDRRTLLDLLHRVARNLDLPEG